MGSSSDMEMGGGGQTGGLKTTKVGIEQDEISMVIQLGSHKEINRHPRKREEKKFGANKFKKG